MKVLYRLYQFFVAAPLLILCTLLTGVVTIVGCSVGNAHFWGYWPGKIWSKMFCVLLLLPVEIRGREHLDEKTSYVFVANHQGAFDIFLIYGYLGYNFKWMMKSSLRRIPLVGKACESASHIFVDKSSARRIHETIEQGRQTLQGGTSLVVFPEGSRTFTGKMDTFRRGAFQLATQLDLPVVPLTIEGSFEVLPRTKGFNFVEYHPLVLTFHHPILPKGHDVEDVRALSDEARSVISSSLSERYR